MSPRWELDPESLEKVVRAQIASRVAEADTPEKHALMYVKDASLAILISYNFPASLLSVTLRPVVPLIPPTIRLAPVFRFYGNSKMAGSRKGSQASLPALATLVCSPKGIALQVSHRQSMKTTFRCCLEVEHSLASKIHLTAAALSLRM